jgi:hypothetical protein
MFECEQGRNLRSGNDIEATLGHGGPTRSVHLGPEVLAQGREHVANPFPTTDLPPEG